MEEVDDEDGATQVDEDVVVGATQVDDEGVQAGVVLVLVVLGVQA